MDDAADEVVGVYRRHAEAWVKARGAKLPEVAWLDGFSALLPSAGSVLDLGCGSGVPVARDLTERGLEVTGVDSAPEMISMFKANLPPQSAQVADMRVLALGLRFSGVIAWDSFFHLTPDAQRAMFPIFAMHGQPGAALMFTSGPHHGEVVGVLEGEPLYHASLSPEEYRLLLMRNGFEVRRHLSEDPACGGRTVWLARKADVCSPLTTQVGDVRTRVRRQAGQLGTRSELQCGMRKSDLGEAPTRNMRVRPALFPSAFR